MQSNLMKYEKRYSAKKGISNTTENTMPVILVILVNFLNKKFNLGFNDSELNSLLLGCSVIYYWLKNWIKNKTVKEI